MDREIVISDLQDISEILIKNGYGGWAVSIGEAIALLKEQEAEIRQLRLALDIAKGTCKGIAMKGR